MVETVDGFRGRGLQTLATEAFWVPALTLAALHSAHGMLMGGAHSSMLVRLGGRAAAAEPGGSC